MLKKLFKKAELQIFAPVSGSIVPLEEVPDPVFSEKMMGEGVAAIPVNGLIFAPVRGTIIQVAPTKHAIGIQAEDGSEILIHIGLETVSLKGEGFKVAVKAGDKVSVGQLLVEADIEFIRANAKSIVIPIVITNNHDGKRKFRVTDEKEVVAGKTVILTAT